MQYGFEIMKNIIILMILSILIIAGCMKQQTKNQLLDNKEHDSKEPKTDITPDFIPSIKVTEISEETGKADQHYCIYDESRNKVAIIIKENGIYDDKQVISKFDEYFSSVKGHLGIDDTGVNKFKGSSVSEFDIFIENLVLYEYVGYIIVVGSDLPITKTTTDSSNETVLLLDTGNIGDKYNYINQFQQPKYNKTGCLDVAISIIVSPQIYSNDEKRRFVISTFTNFINYHTNPQEFYNTYKDILVVGWDNDIPSGAKIGGHYGPTDYQSSGYRERYFYPMEYYLNTEFTNIYNALKNKKLLFKYGVHGSNTIIGIGLSEPLTTNITFNSIYTSLDEFSNFSEKNGQSMLFVNIGFACGQNTLSSERNIFCCWPQQWLKYGVWTIYTIHGDPYHYNFDMWLSEEKIIGKALRKTKHSQNIIYGDILGTFP